MDNRLPNGRFASHHQKCIVVDGDSTKDAFIGGIDIAPDMLDTPDHDNSVLRIKEFFKAWYDIQVKLEGPAVTEVFRCFQERWNDTKKPDDYPTASGEIPLPVWDFQPLEFYRNATSFSLKICILRIYSELSVACAHAGHTHCANSIWYDTSFADENQTNNTARTARQKPRHETAHTLNQCSQCKKKY